MTEIYRFTQATIAGSVSGSAAEQGGSYVGTPWDTGRTGVVSITRPTTRTGIYDAIVAALVAAGWTQHAKVATSGSKDDVFESSGEDGGQNLCIRLLQQTSGRYLSFLCAPKLDASNDLEKAIGGSTAAVDSWDLTTSDFTADLQILASKDFIHVVVQNTNHTSTMYHAFLGNLLPFDSNKNVLTLDAPVAAGEFVQAQTDVNPISMGYRVGDVIQIVNTAKSSTARAESQILVAIDTTSVTFRRLNGSYDAGARIGMRPVPIARRVGANVEFQTAGTPNQFTSPFIAPTINSPSGDFAADNSLATGFVYTDVHYALLDRHAQASSEFGTGTTANSRTLRFTCRSIAVAIAGTGSVRTKGFGGRVPGLYSYNGTASFYPHDHMKEDRMPVGGTTYDYAPFRFTATSSEHYILGPTPN